MQHISPHAPSKNYTQYIDPFHRQYYFRYRICHPVLESPGGLQLRLLQHAYDAFLSSERMLFCVGQEEKLAGL